MAILAKNQIMAELGTFIGSAKQQTALISKVGAASVYHSIKDEDGSIINSVYNELKEKMPATSRHFKDWIISVAPMSYIPKEDKLKVSKNKISEMTMSPEKLYTYMIEEEDFETYKKAETVTKPFTAEEAEKRMEALQKRCTKEKVPCPFIPVEQAQTYAKTYLQKEFKPDEVETTLLLLEMLLKSSDITADELAFVAGMLGRIQSQITEQAA